METPAAIAGLIDDSLRPAGYRLVGVFDGTGPDALAVAGFREGRALAWGHYLYVDDVSTLPTARRAGHAERLMDWLIEKARRLVHPRRIRGGFRPSVVPCGGPLDRTP